MNFQDDIDFTSLGWIKAELDATLRQARTALETYVDHSLVDNRLVGALIRECINHLHLINGTLRMVELFGAALVVEEMEYVAQGLADNSIARREDAYSVLMRGMMQLPDYLERLQSGHKDIPVILLPLLNDLRATRGEKLLSESVLFTPDLDQPLPPPAAPVPNAAELRREAQSLRNIYQIALLRWLRDAATPTQLEQMSNALDRLDAICLHDATRRLWEIAAAALDGVRAGAIEANAAVKLLFGKVDREIKRLVDEGEDVFVTAPSRELAKNLLYYLSGVRIDAPRAAEIQRFYRLDELLPSAQELEHAHGSMSGHNRALLDTVATAVKDDLLRVKETLDIFLRTADHDAAELDAQSDVLDRIADTLGMLGLGVPRATVIAQRGLLADISQGRRRADEPVLLDIAGALLSVEASLDEHIHRLGAAAPTLAGQNSAKADVPHVEIGRLVEALMREASTNLAQVKHDIAAFVETAWDTARLLHVPRLLGEISGALDMLVLHDAAKLIIGIVRFVEIELLQQRRVPDRAELDTLADALSSIDYYIDATREQRSGRERILDIARNGLETLHYWPAPPPQRAAVTTHDDDIARADTTVAPSPAAFDAEETLTASAFATTDFEEPDFDEPDFKESIASVTPDSDHESHPSPNIDLSFADLAPRANPFGFVGSNQSIDSEIREIFLEEVADETGSLQTELPRWRNQPDELELLKPIQRSFHTLKGSGRLVGASELGEFAWKIENLLNRVLDRTVIPGATLQALLARAVAALPELLAALRDDAARPFTDIEAIKQLADRLAAGEPINESEVLADGTGANNATPTQAEANVAKFSDDDTFAQAAFVEEPLAQTAQDAFAESSPTDDAISAANFAQTDPLLFEVLRNEVAEHAHVIDTFLSAAHAHPTQPDAALLHAIHTLNGAIAMVELPQLGAVLIPLEDYVKRLQSWRQPFDAGGVEALQQTSAQIKATVVALERGAVLPETSELAAHVSALRDELPEAELLESLLAPETDAPTPQTTEATHEDAIAPTAFASKPRGGLSFDDAAAIRAALEALDDVQDERLSVPAREVETDEAPQTIDSDELVQTERDEDAIASVANSTDANEFPPGHEIRDASEAKPTYAAPAHVVEPEAIEHVAEEGHAKSAPFASATETPQIEISSVDLAQTIANQEDETSKIAHVDFATSAADSQTHGESVADAKEHAAEPIHEENSEAEFFSEVEKQAKQNAEYAAQAFASSAPAQDEYSVPQIDDDLLDIFIEEAREILDHADTLMARLRESPTDRNLVAALQRDLHTVKGGAHMSALPPIGGLAHAMESLLEMVSEQRREMSFAALAALEQGFDRLHGLVQLVARRQPTRMPDDLIQRIEQLVGGDEADGAALSDLAAVPASEHDAFADAPQPAKTAFASAPEVLAVTPTPATAPAEVDAAQRPAQERPVQEYARVRADLLDTLVNTAGEASIYRSRLQQQVAGFRSNLGEFDATVVRLREQLRTLELETEAQILSRYQRAEDDAAATFDPLELDRFSTLQQLSRSLSESLSDLNSIQGTFEDIARHSETLLTQQSRVNSDLHEGLMRTRMVPFDVLVPTLRRTLRQSATELSKRAQLKVEGAQGEMDRSLLERMRAPFEHMLRNAVAHGIETPAERARAGKPEEGTVTIALAREATEIVLRVRDDGHGLDREAIRNRAIERGLIKTDAQISDHDLYAHILDSGFSTADNITQLAGRGVGMDVVNNEIKQLGGSLSIDSTPGAGVSFSVRLPFTLAMTQAILVRVGETNYAIPLSSVNSVVRIGRDDLAARLSTPEPSFTHASETFAIRNLAHLLGAHASTTARDSQLPLLLARSGDMRVAVRVDAVIGAREIVVKSVGPQVTSVPGVLGATIMGDGAVVIILDFPALLRRAAALQAQGVDLIATTPAAPEQRHLLVMVVDDSITMRKVTTRVLERQGMRVVTAKDGLDAVEKLQEHIPDIVVLDIEMPRMDGYEFAVYMKNDARTRRVPIIMVTSRSGEKHRQRAREIGIERYLGKPYQENELLQNIYEATGTTP